MSPRTPKIARFLRPNTVACVKGIVSYICKIFTYFLHGKKLCLRWENKSPIICGALGHSLMVELRTLTPSVLVRIQLPQPKIQTPRVGVLLFVLSFCVFFLLVWVWGI